MDKFSEAVQELAETIGRNDERVQGERLEIERVLSELAQFKITPFNFLKVLATVKSTVSLLGVIINTCLTTQLSLNETLVDCLKIIKLQQQQIDELRKQL